jgi:outer membrane autotransporter protein
MNLGRTRTMEADWREKAANGGEPISTNGGWETDESIATGGTIVGGPGQLLVVGTIARAENAESAGAQRGSILRVDGGWTLDCFGPVADLETLDLIDGQVILHSVHDDKFTVAVEQIQDNIAVVWPDGELYQNGRNGRVGGVILDCTGYPVDGKISLGTGQKIHFGVKISNDIFYQSGSLVLNGDGVAKHVQFQLEEGGTLALQDFTPGANDLVIDLTRWDINCLVIETPNLSDTELWGNLIGDITKSSQIGDTSYYRVTDARILDFTGTVFDVDGKETLELLFSEDSSRLGLVIARVVDDVVDAPSPVWVNNPTALLGNWNQESNTLHEQIASTPQIAINGPAVQASVEMGETIFFTLDQHLSDVKGNGDDPFFSVFAGHRHRQLDQTLGTGNRGDFYGLLLGEDWAQLLGNGYLRYGAALCYGHTKMDFFGPAAGFTKTAKGDSYACQFFGAYECFDARRLKSNLRAAIGLCHGRNRTDRIDLYEDAFSAKFQETDMVASVEGVRNVLRRNEMQIGPWLGMHWYRIHQRAYTEQAIGQSGLDVAVPSMNHNFLQFVLGMNVEREIQSPISPDRRLGLNGKIGWRYQALRHHSGGEISGPNGPFSSSIYDGLRNAFTVSGGFRARITPNWEFYGQWHSTVSGDSASNSANLSVGYTF